jgi:hypothetical protein
VGNLLLIPPNQGVFLKKNITEIQQSEECDAEEEAVLVTAAQNPEGIFCHQGFGAVFFKAINYCKIP